MRLFLGTFAKIDNLAAIKREFEDIIEAKWVEEENIHLTYLFLGEVENPKDIIFKLKNIQYKKKSIQIRSLGYFGRPPKILYAKIEDNEIEALYKNICKRLGIKIDKKYIPHITLARIKKTKNINRFLTKIEEFKNHKLGNMQLELFLIKSELTPKGPKYLVLEKF
ncbi:RNA 2',3'-cyclic phosphodiesterase [Nitrosophilus labii]|uniref:RNA 2',3'-cyclic phosphodiesterase n=1 Tax=Nitrosophilus labii TaxID=2706014 RepID=UPI001656CD7A|nr:RNA 2',3'-cyclic phosphodiesterase [Nitrosophilus labii]